MTYVIINTKMNKIKLKFISFVMNLIIKPMKILKNILVVVLISIIFTACKSEIKPEIKTVDVKTNQETTKKELDPNAIYAKAEFTIDGMTCEIGCAKTIEKKIANMDGVKTVTVDFDRRLAMVEYDEAMVNHKSLEATVTKTADIYKVSDIKTVEAFSTGLDDDKAKSNKKGCAEDCTKDCCKNKTKTEKKAIE